MLKRPLFIAAVLFAMAAAVLYKTDPLFFLPDIRFQDKERIVLEGTVYQIENRNEKKLIYLKNALVKEEKDSIYQFADKAVIVVADPSVLKNELKIGNSVKSECVFRKFAEARNFGNFDEKEFYHSSGIFLKAFASDFMVTDRRTDFIRQFLYTFKNEMIRSINESIDDPEIAGILTAICTGDRSGLSEETRELYRKSGIAHILAISGLHISLIGMGIFRIIRKKLSFLYSALISAVFVMGFCIMTGLSASGIRAAVMFAVQMTAVWTGKNYDLLNSLSLSVILLLISNPLFIINQAFQLSVMSLVSVGILFRPLEMFMLFEQNKLCLRILKAPENNLSCRLIRGFLMSLSITLGTLPIICSLYFEIPVYSIVINIVIIPVMTATLGMGMISAVTGIFNVVMGRFFAGIGIYATIFVKWICAVFNSLPAGSVVVGQPSIVNTAVYYFLLLTGTCFIKLFIWLQINHPDFSSVEFSAVVYSGSMKKGSDRKDLSFNRYIALIPGSLFKKIRFRKIIILISAAVLIIQILFFQISSGKLVISFIDVDQGECILIESPSDRVYMIDAGSVSVDKVVQYRAASAIKYKGISNIDYVIVTHPDTDHISGIIEMLENCELLNIKLNNLLTPYIPENENYKRLVRCASEHNVNVTDLFSGICIEDGSLVLRCLHPGTDYQSEDSNGYSAVMELVSGEFSALFTGDIGENEEKLLLSEYSDRLKKYNLLKVAHHGSGFSSSYDFLKTVSPDIAVISAGINNIYGHPHKETIDRLNAVGTKIYVTAEKGEIIISADNRGKMRVRSKL